MRKITILEIKDITSENFDCYIKYEDKLFFSKKIIEIFRHKTSIYSQSDPYNYKWYYKSGHEVNSSMAHWAYQQIKEHKAIHERKTVQVEIQSIKV